MRPAARSQAHLQQVSGRRAPSRLVSFRDVWSVVALLLEPVWLRPVLGLARQLSMMRLLPWAATRPPCARRLFSSETRWLGVSSNFLPFASNLRIGLAALHPSEAVELDRSL